MGTDHLAAFVFGIILTAVFVGTLIGLIVIIGFWLTAIVVGIYTAVAGWMLLTGRDGPGGMQTREREL